VTEGVAKRWGRSGAVAVCVLAAGSATAACGGGGVVGGSDERLDVATTVSPITSIVASIAGDRAEVIGIVPEGVNSHTFEPPPSTAELLSRVDVLYTNGLKLEDPTRDLAEAALEDGAEIIELGTLALPASDYIYDFSFPEEGGKPNPHLWTDPRYALAYAQIVTDDLAERDPRNADYYRDNLEDFSAMVEELDAAMLEAFATIPEANKKLLTYHDSFPYFAEHYGWEVIGAIQVADFEEPTPREVARLIEQVRAEEVPAIFGSEVFPSPVLEQIARETGVEYVADLRDDDLPGEPGDPEHSWVGLMLLDYITMTTALGGDATALEELELQNDTPDAAHYPQ
jgi:ABC-type Zn uptake system ZnuABC Zn-binding protein ZnuA